MRIVVDTNVLVAAVASPDGASREVLRRCLLGVYRPLLGETLSLEYEDVLQRLEPFVASPVSRAEREALWASFAACCEWTRIHYLWRPNLRDEDDNHLVELAIAGGAEAVITHNIDDLRSGELRFPQLRVLTPAALIKENPAWPP